MRGGCGPSRTRRGAVREPCEASVLSHPPGLTAGTGCSRRADYRRPLSLSGTRPRPDERMKPLRGRGENRPSEPSLGALMRKGGRGRDAQRRKDGRSRWQPGRGQCLQRGHQNAACLTLSLLFSASHEIGAQYLSEVRGGQRQAAAENLWSSQRVHRHEGA